MVEIAVISEAGWAAATEPEWYVLGGCFGEFMAMGREAGFEWADGWRWALQNQKICTRQCKTIFRRLGRELKRDEEHGITHNRAVA